MTWHPDRSSHPEATERFKQIRAAYEALLSRDEDEIDGLDSSPANEQEEARAADIRIDLELTLEDAAFGCSTTLEFPRGTTCTTCEGSGESGVSRSRPCQACHGSGRTRHRQHGLALCKECGGRGYFTQRVCPDCDGKGKHIAQVNLLVTVPAGMLPGDELRLVGQGEPGLNGLAPGNLLLKLVIRAHALFQLEGCDLSYTMPVSSLRLLAGGRIEVPGLGGAERIKLEAGDLGPRTVRLAGKGYPGRRSPSPGDLIIHLEPVQPRRFNAEQRRILEQAAAACEETLGESLPEIAAWRQRYRF